MEEGYQGISFQTVIPLQMCSIFLKSKIDFKACESLLPNTQKELDNA